MEIDEISTPPVWAGLSSDAMEAQYNPRVAVPDFTEIEASFQEINARARTSLPGHFDVAYGAHPLHTLDIFPAAATTTPSDPSSGANGAGASGAGGTPVHIFYHGGFWRAQDKANYSYIAHALVARGITAVIANYELCPASTLDGVVESALQALEWTVAHIGSYGGDPAQISISGASAGAHLCAVILSTDWASRGHPDMTLTGAALISGIFDPEPARLISLNQTLGLDVAMAARHNVERRPLQIDCPMTLFVGGAEPWQWIDQTFRYSRFLRQRDCTHALHVLPRKNHFSIMHEYLDPDSVLLNVIACPSTSLGSS
jgi:arylformamidase